MEKLPTINLKGREYVQVKERVLYFNETYLNGSIETELIASSTSMVTFRAVVMPDTDKPIRRFTGHAFGTVDEIKAFEKLETVAVGRALALMGIGVLESVASADEMQRFETKQSVKPKPTARPTVNGSTIEVCTDYLFDSLVQSGQFSLDSGLSKKTGKPWYIVTFKEKKYWITETQHKELSK